MPVYEKRRAVLKAINKFWAVALMNHPLLSMHVQHNADQAALSYLEDVWLTRDPVESRCFTLEFVSSPTLSHRAATRTAVEVEHVWLTRSCIAALQGEPVLFEHGAQEGVQVRAATGGV